MLQITAKRHSVQHSLKNDIIDNYERSEFLAIGRWLATKTKNVLMLCEI